MEKLLYEKNFVKMLKADGQVMFTAGQFAHLPGQSKTSR